jgi:serine/threonine protein kinase
MTLSRPFFSFHGPGYKYFVMEKMDSTITGIVPLLLETSSKKKTIQLGPIAVRMLECLKAVHERNNIFRDVKTENFMLAPASAGKGKGSTSLEKKLTERVRLIDFAMVSQWTPTYRETSESSNLLGTPLYASLNVHNGQKTSFRDDLEALGYVIAELIHQLVSGDDQQQLPWANERSDDAIGSMKEKQVNNHKSDFYSGMGTGKTASLLSEFITEVQSYTFKQRPDYEKLAKILSQLETSRCTKASSTSTAVSRPPRTSTKAQKTTTKRARSKAPPVAAPANSKSRRKYDSEDDSDDSDDPMDWDYTDENSQPKTKSDNNQDSNKMTAREQRAARRRNNSDNVIVIDDDDDDDDDEAIPAASASAKKKSGKVHSTTSDSAASGLSTVGVVIEVEQGPHEGERFTLSSGDRDTVVVGTNPSGGSLTGIVLKKDKSLKSSHVKLELSVKRNVVSVNVTDKSKGDTCINGTTVKSSKAFIHDRISIGETVLVIKGMNN